LSSDVRPYEISGLSLNSIDCYLEILLAVADAPFTALAFAKVHRIKLFALDDSFLGRSFE
jgi:hypothetical protein